MFGVIKQIYDIENYKPRGDGVIVYLVLYIKGNKLRASMHCLQF
jgi:hypothetical protein